MKCRVIDTETTGFPPEAGIVEIGWCDVDIKYTDEGKFESTHVGIWKNELVNPDRKIEIAAMAVHHIQDADLIGCRKPDEVIQELAKDVDYFVAHNSKFERAFIDVDIPWICTYKAALRLCPKSPNHQNQTIRYYLNTPCDPALCIPAHRAGPDAYVTAHTLAKFLTAAPIKTLVEWEQLPPLFPFCPIGKARGQAWADVERGFLAWCTRQPSMDPDILWNVKRELDRRDGRL